MARTTKVGHKPKDRVIIASFELPKVENVKKKDAEGTAGATGP